MFLALWREPGRFDPDRGAFASWLLTLVHHKAVDAVRREATSRRRTVPVEDAATAAPPGPGADHDALAGVVAGQVRDALSPAGQRRPDRPGVLDSGRAADGASRCVDGSWRLRPPSWSPWPRSQGSASTARS
ncbi:hypothetical protein LWC33_24085 [Pseudonocardia sp. RS11V-5]|nr:hypothetical protein [Pseudonocardia terrae]